MSVGLTLPSSMSALSGRNDFVLFQGVEGGVQIAIAEHTFLCDSGSVFGEDGGHVIRTIADVVVAHCDQLAYLR